MSTTSDAIIGGLIFAIFIYILYKLIGFIDKTINKIMGGEQNAIYDKEKDRREKRGDATDKGCPTGGRCEDADNRGIPKA